QCLNGHETVKRRFTRKESGLAPMRIVPNMSEQPRASGAADQRGKASIRERLVMADLRGIVGQVLAKVRVRHKETGCESTGGHEPFRIRKLKARRTRPDLFLIEQEVHCEVLDTATRGPIGMRLNRPVGPTVAGTSFLRRSRSVGVCRAHLSLLCLRGGAQIHG